MENELGSAEDVEREVKNEFDGGERKSEAAEFVVVLIYSWAEARESSRQVGRNPAPANQRPRPAHRKLHRAMATAKPFAARLPKAPPAFHY